MTRAVWDRVRLAEVVREAAAQADWLAPVAGTEPIEQPTRAARTGRPAEYTDEHYRAVGRVYSAAVAEGQPPVRAVARAFEGRPHPTRPDERLSGLLRTSDKRARTWVRAARARGYITDSTPQRGDQE